MSPELTQWIPPAVIVGVMLYLHRVTRQDIKGLRGDIADLRIHMDTGLRNLRGISLATTWMPGSGISPTAWAGSKNAWLASRERSTCSGNSSSATDVAPPPDRAPLRAIQERRLSCRRLGGQGGRSPHSTLSGHKRRRQESRLSQWATRKSPLPTGGKKVASPNGPPLPTGGKKTAPRCVRPTASSPPDPESPGWSRPPIPVPTPTRTPCRPRSRPRPADPAKSPESPPSANSSESSPAGRSPHPT